MHVNQKPRRRHSEQFKAQVMTACGEPGASVSAVALSFGLNTNMVRQWQRGRGYKPNRPAIASQAAGQVQPQFVALSLPSPNVQAAPVADVAPQVIVGVVALPSDVTANWPFASARTQFVRLALGMPSVAATSDAARPALTCRTASCLNSGVYFALVCFSFNSCSRPGILRVGAMHSRVQGQPQWVVSVQSAHLESLPGA